MTAEPSDTAAAFGFISVIRSAKDDLFGGYLILNEQGRPLEFHCTAPVQANRAQEILYGVTLQPFLYGEQIAQTLWSAAQRSPAVVCTDVLPVLALQSLISTPVVWIADRLPIEGVKATTAMELAKLVDRQQADLFSTLGTVHPFAYADHVLVLSESMSNCQDDVTKQLAPLLDLIEISEPFARIQAAVEEAHRNALGEPRHRQAG